MTTNAKNGVHKNENMGEVPDSLRSLLGGSDVGVRSTRKLVDGLRDAFPIVAEILGGIEAGKGQPEVLPGSITITIREGKIRFTVNVKSAKKTFFGDVADVLNPWGSINYALATGSFSEREFTERPDRLTEEQKSLLL